MTRAMQIRYGTAAGETMDHTWAERMLAELYRADLPRFMALLSRAIEVRTTLCATCLHVADMPTAPCPDCPDYAGGTP